MLFFVLGVIIALMLLITFFLYRIAANQIALNTIEQTRHNELIRTLKDTARATNPNSTKSW